MLVMLDEAQVRDAEVHDLRAAVFGDADVGGLDIAVNDSALVGVGKPGENIRSSPGRAGDVAWPIQRPMRSTSSWPQAASAWPMPGMSQSSLGSLAAMYSWRACSGGK